jgi:hypothetical protein
MASDVPVKEDLRRITDWHAEYWHAESGKDRLETDLIDGILRAWWQHPTTGEYHEIPRACWREEGAVKRAVGGFGWRLGGGLFSSEPFRVAAIYAAYAPRRVKHAGGRKPIYDWPAAHKEMRAYVRENGRPKKPAPLVKHIEGWFTKRDQYPSNSKVREHVGEFFARNSVKGKKAPQKSKST